MSVPHKKKASVLAIALAVILWMVFLGIIIFIVLQFRNKTDTNKDGGNISSYTSEQSSPSYACDIKGNISYRTKEKIYHLSGQKYYDKTQIDTSMGERMFCTETEAQSEGWRKSYE